MENTKKYYYAVDFMRILAILCVVLIHTTTKTFEAVQLQTNLVPLSLILNQAVRFAVPLFFIISGFVLEASRNKDLSWGAYAVKRTKRILVPYLFWSGVYFYRIYTNHPNTTIGEALLTGSASNQLYFLPTLIIYYAAYPLLSRYLCLLNNKPTAGLLAAGQALLLYMDYYREPLPIYYPVKVALLNLFPFIFGIIAYHRQEKIFEAVKKLQGWFLAGAAGMMGLIVWEGQYRYGLNHDYLMIYSQWRPSIFIYSLLIFCLLFYYFNKEGRHLRIVKKLSSLSFFVFFIHMIFVEIVWNKLAVPYVIQRSLWNQVWYEPFFWAAVTGMSFATGYLVHRIPVLKRLTS